MLHRITMEHTIHFDESLVARHDPPAPDTGQLKIRVSDDGSQVHLAFGLGVDGLAALTTITLSRYQAMLLSLGITHAASNVPG